MPGAHVLAARGPLCATLLAALWGVLLAGFAPATARAQEGEVYDERPALSPLLPWTPPEQMYDWLDVSRYWNLYHRGGRFQLGLVGHYTSFAAVAGEETTISPVPPGTDPALRDPNIHNADVVDTHATVQFGLTLFEPLRLRLGAGASLTQIRASERYESLADVSTDGYRRYGWGLHYLVGLELAPVFQGVPTWMLPVFEVDLLGWTAKNDEGRGTMHGKVLRGNLKLYFELGNSPREGVSLGLYVGAGYHHYFGEIDLPSGRTLSFTSPGGGNAALPFGDVDLLAGVVLVVDDRVALRVEGASGMPSVRAVIEVIGQ